MLTTHAGPWQVGAGCLTVATVLHLLVGCFPILLQCKTCHHCCLVCIAGTVFARRLLISAFPTLDNLGSFFDADELGPQERDIFGQVR